jgi:diguanylate cyclase (GGDEF)-like protein/PAS domain S-box-containing protein
MAMSRQSHRHFIESFSDTLLYAPMAIGDDPFRCGRVAAELAQARRRFEATFHHAPVGMAHVGMDGSFLLVNPRFCEIAGHDAAALMSGGFQRITHPDDLGADEHLLARLHAGELTRYAMEKRYIRADGTVIWINLTVAMVRDESDRPEFYVAVIEDLSDLRQASFEAVHDPLTGLLNRRGLASRAKDMLADAVEEDRSVSLIFVDLDGFKALNDRRGHAAGDACLVAVGQALQACVAAGDVVARVGGDEFVILLAGLRSDEARALGERMRVALSAQGDGVAASLGLIHNPAGSAADLDMLIGQADIAMLAAKRAGKNRLLVA